MWAIDIFTKEDLDDQALKLLQVNTILSIKASTNREIYHHLINTINQLPAGHKVHKLTLSVFKSFCQLTIRILLAEGACMLVLL